MKRTICLLLLLLGLSFFVIADEAQINLEYQHKHNHNEYYPPVDMPEAYYDASNQEIVIYADGSASYYDVDIVSQSTMQLVFYTTIGGYGDSIDVSSLPDDNYTIIITSSYNNEYVGQFTNY